MPRSARSGATPRDKAAQSRQPVNRRQRCIMRKAGTGRTTTHRSMKFTIRSAHRPSPIAQGAGVSAGRLRPLTVEASRRGVFAAMGAGQQHCRPSTSTPAMWRAAVSPGYVCGGGGGGGGVLCAAAPAAATAAAACCCWVSLTEPALCVWLPQCGAA